MKLLAKYVKGYTAQLILGPLFKLIEAILELFIPVLMASMIDVGVKNGDFTFVLQRGLLMLALAAIGLCCGITCQYFAAVCAHGFGRSLRQGLFCHIYALSARELGTLGTDTLMTRMTNDVTQVETGLNMLIRLAMRAPFLAIGSIVMAFTINARIATIFLVSVPLIVLVLYIIMRRSVPFYKQIQKKQDAIARLAGESLAGVRVIRAFSRQKSEQEQFEAAGDSLAQATVRVGVISAALNPLTSVITNLAIAAILWFGASAVDGGTLLQGEVIALVNYMTQTLLALIVLANLVVIFTKAIASAQRVSDVLRMESTLPEPAESAQAMPGAPCVAFENVSFAYCESGDVALEHISFSLDKGQTLGIIGGTGSGKTTIVRLLSRDYDVTDGAVLVDGVDVRAYRQSDLHAKLGVVPQGATLFSGTVRSNLQSGRQKSTDEALWHALALAQGKDFVQKLAQGLDAPVKQGGTNFSGGQKQRLTIARALAAQPEILVLDDASSALDYATDAALRKALKTQTQDMAVIMVSQRAAALRQADSILVLDDGKAVGYGTHEELLEQCEVYREICRTQGIQEATV